MIVKITQEHVDESKRLLSIPGAKITKCCPISIALMDAGFPYVRSSAMKYRGTNRIDTHFSFHEDGYEGASENMEQRQIIYLPEWVGRKLRSFDETQNMDTFEFEIEDRALEVIGFLS